MIDNSEISQETETQPRGTVGMSRSGKILPNKQGQEFHTDVMPKPGEISPGRIEESGLCGATERVDEISPREPNEVMDLVAMEEGAVAWTPNENTHSKSKGEKGPQEEENLLNKSPQIDTAQHYLDDNFSDVMRSSVLGSNMSSLFNTTTFTTTHSEQKVTLDWDSTRWKEQPTGNIAGQAHHRLPSTGGNYRSNVSTPAGPGTVL